MWYAIIALAFVLVAALAFYAGQLLWKVKQQQQAQQQERAKKIKYLTDSIGHIAKAMDAEQCEISEGVLRIWVLLDHYKQQTAGDQNYQELYKGFASLYEVIKDMPTHDARKKLGKQERFNLDVRRWDAEKEFAELIKQDLQSILEAFPTTLDKKLAPSEMQ
ncbi:MAG: DUF2489 domain-containing protein [Gammaproteobacteria bacterium]|nr:DUF2489 domain-containing protein [Gammaproteobacteria bacterium]